MERRLTRARNKVTDARIPFRVPPDDLLAERLAGVLRVVYLVFNEGHAATARGDLRARGDPARAAARAADARRGRGARAARAAAADRRAVGGARVRRRARVAGRPGPGAWDARRSPRASRCSSARCGCRGPGPYAIQAAIAALHSQAPRLRRHRLGADRRALRGARAPRSLAGGRGQPRRRGRASRTGREAGLALLPDDPRLDRYVPLHAARAELLRRAGDVHGADAALRDRDRALRQRGRARGAARGCGSANAALTRAREREPATRRPSRARSRPLKRRVAARAGEDRDGDRDPEHAAELAQRAVRRPRPCRRLRRDGVDDRVLRRRASPSRRRRRRSSARGTSCDVVHRRLGDERDPGEADAPAAPARRRGTAARRSGRRARRRPARRRTASPSTAAAAARRRAAP